MKKYLPSIVLATIFFLAYKIDKMRSSTEDEDFHRPLAVLLNQPHHSNGKLKKTKLFNSLYRQSRFDTLGFYPFIDAALTNALYFQSKQLNKSPKKTYRVGNLKFSNKDINYVINTLQSFQFSFPVGLNSYFDFYQIKGNDNRGSVKFSAYYTPVIRASKARSEEFSYPVYERPEDWEGKLPTRQEIENDGVLEGKDLCLGYVRSRKELYNIQLQGSAILKFKDGSSILLAYDGDNNRVRGDSQNAPKVSKKNVVKEKSDAKESPKEEVIEESEEDSLEIEIGIADAAVEAEAEEKGVSKEEVEAEYKENDEEKNTTDSTDNEGIKKIFDEKSISENPNYVFFKKVNDRLQSSSGLPLSAYTSIATDTRYIPTGAVLLAATPIVDKNENCKYHALQFVLAQDTGGGIHGSGHVDWYVGQGDKAEKIADRIHHYGQLWLVLPKKKANKKLTLAVPKTSNPSKSQKG
jgi:membrane-bound lytic murein transglycosylase A